MPDLEMLLRDVRPVPDPAWAARLDARVAARFPGPPPRWKRPFIAVRDHFLALGAIATVATAAVAFVLVVSSIETGGDDEPAGGSAEPAMQAPESDSGGGGASIVRRRRGPERVLSAAPRRPRPRPRSRPKAASAPC